jgi:RNA polymerase sigma factor (sigma-70 family)
LHSRLPDIELWYAFKKGDRDAFGELFRRHYSLLYQYGIKLCTDATVVEDCIQELFIELWQNKSDPRVQSVKAYMLTAIKYKIFKIYRNSPETKTFETAPGDMNFEIGQENFIIAREEDRQKTQRIITAFRQLPPRQKEMIYLKIYQNLSYDEICEVMGINYQVARNLFSQSLKSLRKVLNP